MNTVESAQTARRYVHGSPLRSRHASELTASLRLAPDAILFLASAAVLIAAGALNATLIYDDVYWLDLLPQKIQMFGLLGGIKYIFFGVDLSAWEFRLYGLSRLLHLLLYQIFGVHAWAYAAVICATQAVCGWGIYRLLRAYQVEEFQAAVCGILWMYSSFVATSCFHHYSYLILPFQLTLLCALVLRAEHDDPETEHCGWRAVSGVIGLLIAYTGESHIITAGFVIVLVPFLTSSRRMLSSRIVDCLVPLVVIAAAVAVYRWEWAAVVPANAGRVRFAFMLPGWAQVWPRTLQFFASLPPAAFEQLRAIFTFAGASALVVAIVAVSGGTWILLWNGRLTAFRSIAIKLKPVDIALPAVLGLVALSSFGIFYLVHVLSPAGSEMVPFSRRYGYVPYTLVLMFGGSCLSAPWMRRLLGAGPAVFYCLAVICTWIVLQTACLPVVRGQDRQVWNALAAALNGKRDPSVLLVSGSTWHGEGGREVDLATPFLRRIEFPPIFESPLTSYWWASGYARVVLGARFVGYWYRDEGEGRLRLIDNDLRGPTKPVPIDSVVVLASNERNPPDWGKPADRAAIFTDWAAFKAAAVATDGGAAGTVSK